MGYSSHHPGDDPGVDALPGTRGPGPGVLGSGPGDGARMSGQHGMTWSGNPGESDALLPGPGYGCGVTIVAGHPGERAGHDVDSYGEEKIPGEVSGHG